MIDTCGTGQLSQFELLRALISSSTLLSSRKVWLFFYNSNYFCINDLTTQVDLSSLFSAEANAMLQWHDMASTPLYSFGASPSNRTLSKASPGSAFKADGSGSFLYHQMTGTSFAEEY